MPSDWNALINDWLAPIGFAAGALFLVLVVLPRLGFKS